MNLFELKHVTVRLSTPDAHAAFPAAGIVVSCTAQEAFALLTMPCLSGLVVEMIPEYGLSSVSDTENKE